MAKQENTPYVSEDDMDVRSFMELFGIKPHATTHDLIASVLRSKGLAVFSVERYWGCHAWRVSIARQQGFDANVEGVSLRLKKILEGMAGLKLARQEPWLQLCGPRLYFRFTARGGRAGGIKFASLSRGRVVDCRIKYPAGR